MRPAPRPTWVLADTHAGHSAEADAALLDLLDRARGARADLLVMGDLFLAWLGPARFWTGPQREVLDAFARAREAGARVRFVVGNRDYLVEGTEGAFDEVLHGEALIDLGGAPTLVLHGDRVNPNDWPYHLWYRLSRSRPVSEVLARLPGALGRGLAVQVEARMGGMSTRYKAGTLPLAALEGVGRRARDRGAERALVGHFHHDRVLDVADGVPVVLAPGWFVERRVLVCAGDGALRSTAVERLGR